MIAALYCSNDMAKEQNELVALLNFSFPASQKKVKN
jgi:hypothetical protein